MKHISAASFREILDAERGNPSVAFINVCSPDEYRSRHIDGVASLPLDQIEARRAELEGKRTIYVHCRSGNRSQRAIETLERLGLDAEFVNVDGGQMAWESQGFQTVSLSRALPLTQQVFVAAGSLVLLGVGLVIWKGPAFLAIPLFVGAGLVFAGFTGWCGMGILLSKMPWNRRVS